MSIFKKIFRKVKILDVILWVVSQLKEEPKKEQENKKS